MEGGGYGEKREETNVKKASIMGKNQRKKHQRGEEKAKRKK